MRRRRKSALESEGDRSGIDPGARTEAAVESAGRFSECDLWDRCSVHFTDFVLSLLDFGQVPERSTHTHRSKKTTRRD